MTNSTDIPSGRPHPIQVQPADRSDLSAGAWPFWKMVPRFDREYSSADLLSALSSLARQFDPDAESLAQFFGRVPFCLARSGREALYLILKMMKLRAHSRVGAPLYCCTAVFEAIAAAGHVPFFLDIDLDTYALDPEFLRKHKNEIDALIVVHTFGYPANLHQLRDSLSGRNVPVIEDCAHALFSCYQGRPTGSWTEASFFSFGLHKPAAVGGGASIFINDSDLALQGAREVSNLTAESKRGEIRHTLTCWARSLMYQRFTYGALLSSPLGRTRDAERSTMGAAEAGTEHVNWFPGRIRRVDQILLDKRIREFQTKLPALALNTYKLRSAIQDSPLKIPQEPAYGEWNHFMVPVRYENEEQRELGRQLLTRRRVDTSPLYQNCVRNARRFGYQHGCRRAELASETVCTVPNHTWLSEDEISYIGESLRNSIR
jgi:perosamine synthetase